MAQFLSAERSCCLFNQISSNLVKLQQFRSNLTFQHKSCLQQHEEMVLQTFPWA